MKKRYTSDPKQASRRNAFANKNFLILLAFLAVCPVAWAWSPSSAGTYYLRSTGTGNNFDVYTGATSSEATLLIGNQPQLNGFTISSGTYKLVFENTSTIIMNGQIFVYANEGIEAHLVMELGTGASANPTLKITGMSRQAYSDQDVVFYIYKNVTTTKDQHTITVQGKNPSADSPEDISNYVYDFRNNFVIDGDGPVLTAIDDGTSTPQMEVTTAGNSKSYGLFRIQEGTLTMKNVTVQNFATTWGNGGVIQVFTNQNNAKVLADIDHCHFKSLASKNEIVLKVQSGGTYNDQPTSGQNAGLNVGLRDAKFKNCKIEYTFGCNTTYSTLYSGYTQTVDTQNGTFRSIGQNSVTISLENCHLTNNYGCPVRWHGSRSKDKLIVNHCKIENNYTLTGSNVNGGGGLLLKGPAQISQCTIQYNRTNGDGGGIYLSTYTDFGGGTENLVPDHSILELDGQTLIDHNTAAGSGGGVAIDGVRMKNNQSGANYDYPNGPNGYIWYNPDNEPFKLRFVLGGATISNNKALGGAGGGVWINRNEEVTYYKVECELDKGTISGNECSVNGGGVAVITTQNFNNPSAMPSHVHPQDVIVTVSKEGEAANKITIEGNTASNYAGGIYVEAYPVTYNNTTSVVSTTVYDYSEIKTNTATSHGGGLYVKRGTVNVAKTGTVQPLIQGNMANTYHGGGIYLDDGTINISGGLVKDNKATAHGGGIYNNNGTISLTNSSEVSGNKAGTYNGGTNGNGGGIYTQSGTVSVSNSTVKGNECQKLGGGIYTLSGNITLTNATIGGDKTANEGNQTVHTDGDGGGIYTQNGAVDMTGSTVQGNTAKRNGGGVYVANNSVTMHSCTIGGNAATLGNTTTTGSGGGIYVGNGAVLINPDATFVGNPSNISYNTAQVHGGGMYVANGRVVAYGSFTESTYYPITITHNQATDGSGGGIFCMGNGTTTYFDIRLRRVIVSHNKALGTANASSPINLGCGGGMYLDEGKISVISGDISNNEANVGGGGIYTRQGDININGTQDEHTATQITDNTAGLNGGGVNTHSGTVTILGNSPSQRINISGNTATTGSGGGIFCYGTNVNTKYITLLHADLNDNHAAEGGGTQTVLGNAVVSGRGGGMYLQKGIIDITDVKIQQNTAALNGGGINNHEGNIDVNGCLIGGGAGLGNMAGYNSSTGQQNSEGSGGGIYTNAGDIDIEDYVETTGGMTRIESKITHNTAVLNGGGADTRSGTIYINRKQRGDQIEISHNTAKKGGGLYANAGTIYTYNALIDNNTATLNGGGINNHAGDIFIYGGSLSNNMATEGRGGGAYTDVGDIDIMQFPYDDDPIHQDTLYGTKIYNNIAKLNGGAVNNHTGLVDVRYATIRNNTSTLGNGGAIYCEGPHANTTGKTIRLQRSILDRNKTRGADGTATDPTGRGGGIYLKYGSIFAQGAIITRNSANINGGGVDNHDGDIRLYGCIVDNNTAVEGSGGGVYTLHGDITTGPCYLYKATQITNNTAARNGGGINNGDLSVSSADKGNIYLNGDLIKGNTAQNGDGGGIYIADGQIDMFGGKIAENTANSGNGGGVYSGGGEFNIQKRQGKPVVEVIDAYPGPTSGSAPSDTIHYHLMFAEDANTSHEHGFKYAVRGSTTPTTVQVSTTDLTPGCYKYHLTGLTEATTYWVVAYATNDNGTNVSDTTWFTTLSSNKPTVYTGGSANVTKNSATLNGKWIDQGSSDITEVGFVYSLTNPTPTIGAEGCNPVNSTDIDGKFFTLPLTGLTANKTYYFRAYAKNSHATDDTGYGDVATFTTLKNTPDMGSTTVDLTTTTDYTTTPFTNTITASFTMPAGTNFTNPGGANYITSYGFVWSTDDDPELYSDRTIPGTLTSGTTTFTATYVGARGGLTVYVRAYASSNADEPAAMDITNYSITAPTQTITPSTDGSPVVRATNIQDITQHDAKIYGKLIDKGTSAITQYGIVWSATNAEPTLESYEGHNTVTASLENGAEFTLAMTGLDPGKTYYVRTFATNSTGTAYSNNFSFTALGITMPQVTINEVTDITENSAKVQCSFTDGGANVNYWGVKYSTNSDMSGAIVVENPGTTLSGNTFTADLPKTGEDPLDAYTTYYVQAYATNSAGTHTCRAITFTTADHAKPTVDNVALSSISLPTGSSNESTILYQVTPADGTTVRTHGVAWSTLRNPKRQESEVTNTHFAETLGASVTSATTFTKTRTQAYPNMTYYVRAYASKENPDANNTLANIVYSDEISFVTLPVVATPEDDDAVSNLTNNSATLKGTIVSRDTEGHLRDNMRGVCWSTSTNPTRTGTNYAEETITTTSGVSVNYTVDATNLTAGTTYYYRAYYYRSSSDNAITYGEERTFTTKAYGLNIAASPTEGGTVNKTHVGLDEGETCEVTATENAGYTFNNWTVSGTGAAVSDASNATTTFTMGTSNATLTANFTPNSYNLSVVVEPTGAGNVTVNGTAYSAPVSVTYNTTSVTLLATPATDYQFINWTVNGNVVSSENPYTFTYDIAGDATFVANFESTRGRRSGTQTPRLQEGSQTSRLQNTPRPRDIYPAPAREPWLWNEDPLMQPDDTLAPTFDTLAYREETQTTSLVDPIDIPLVEHNTAQYGGGIYMDKNTTSPAKLVFSGGSNTGERGKIMYNYASEAGGGIYIDTTALMHMKGHCEVNGNYVPTNHDGGGIYLKGRLYVGETGTSASANGLITNQNFAYSAFDTSAYNPIPATCPADHKAYLNNVCLMRHTYNYDHSLVLGTYDDESTVITLLSDITGSGAASNIGFHVTQGFCPVIATSYGFGKEYTLAEDGNSTCFPSGQTTYTLDTYESWLHSIMTSAVGSDGLFNSNGAIFEDTESYVAIHTATPSAPFNSKYIYLWGCWTHPAVKSDPETNNPMAGEGSGGAWLHHYKITNPDDNAANSSFEPNNNNPLKWEIYSEEGLAWFSAYVNGLNVFKDGDAQHHKYVAEKNSKAEAVLMADLDLSAHFWVPIGSVTTFQDAGISGGNIESLFVDEPGTPHHFKGKFDGQGHSITGIDCRYLSGIYKLGLLGYLDEGAVVKNLFVDGSRFEASSSSMGFHIGGIAGKMLSTATLSACEARANIDITNADKTSSYVGGLVGEAAGTNTIHSSMAMPTITGAADYMGGLVGKLGSGNKLYNSFSNPKFPQTTTPWYAMNTDKYIGGLVGENNGIVENCYSRLQGSEPTSDGTASVYGWLAGSNTVAASESSEGGIRFSYIPDGQTVYVKNTADGSNKAPYGHGTYAPTTRIDGKYGYKHRDQAMTKANDSESNSYIDNDKFEGGLQTALNKWVDGKNTSTKTYHPWMRTMASGINDDLPIPNFKRESGAKALTTDPAYNAVGSKDGVYMDYANNANDLLTAYAALASGTPEIYLYEANESDGDPTDPQPKPITVTNVGTSPEVKLYIHEDVGITVSGNASSSGLNARVGAFFDNSEGTTYLGGEPYDWHMFSPAIKDVPMGIEYHSDNTDAASGGKSYSIKTNYSTLVSSGIAQTDYESRDYMDPPVTTIAGTGYLRSNTPYGKWGNSGHWPSSGTFANSSFDLYSYYEKECHWINFKREGTSTFSDHWHQDVKDGETVHRNIRYENETTMRLGKGYMMAFSDETMVMADGILNTGNLTASETLTNTYYSFNPSGYADAVQGINLVGNPYQSYLDFDLLASGNNGILVGGSTTNYYILDADSAGYISYTAGSSNNVYGATRYIHPHQGFFVRASAGGSLSFTDAMRVAGKYTPNLGDTENLYHANFRNEQVNYPLVNLLCYDADGKRDYTTVEINRPDVGGGQKMKGLRIGDATICARWEGIDYQTAFTPEGVSEVPVRFEAFDDEVFTMKWNTLHGDFHYLHLIDNLTGADVDMLTAQEYKFEGRTTDYVSRFKLVFDVTGIEEPEDGTSTDPVTFAFQMGDELIVNGAGVLQMFDITGRCLLSTQTAGAQSSVSLPKVAAGVYLLRMTGNQQSKIQKIIIK
ncbi:MAG: T9SS type A sorting domain-containing protein [Bacteroidales bacterium]|nr:T9SS type A sorting domain-containing protein [Bacteroidales bacterium]